MRDLDVARLLKLLNLSRSDNDHEALLAIRKANELLNSAGSQWADCVQAIAPVTKRHANGDSRIAMMLKHCLANISGEPVVFIRSLNDQYIKRGFLSEKQRSALQKFYDNSMS